MFTHFVANSEKKSQIRFYRGVHPDYYIGGVIEIYYNTTKGGGLPDLLQYYNGEGGLSGPQICIT